MKLRKNTVFTAALVASLAGLSGFASAQINGNTYSYFFGGTAQQTADGTAPYDFTNTLAASGYASQQLNHQTGVTSTTNAINSATSPNFFGQNRLSTSIDLGTFNPLVGTGIDGSTETITKVTLLLYVDAATPAAGIKTFSLYTGINSTTSPVSTFSVGPADVGGFISIDVPLAVAFNGFTIGNGTNMTNAFGLNTGSEDNSSIDFRPGYRVDTIMTLAVPEPSTALLGGLGALVLLRRRRA